MCADMGVWNIFRPLPSTLPTPLPYASLLALPDPHLRVLRVRPLAVCMGGSNFESSVSGLGQDMRHVTISDFRLCQLCLAHRERGGDKERGGGTETEGGCTAPSFRCVS